MVDEQQKVEEERYQHFRGKLSGKSYDELNKIVNHYNNAWEIWKFFGRGWYSDLKAKAAKSLIDEMARREPGQLEGKVITGEVKASQINL